MHLGLQLIRSAVPTVKIRAGEALTITGNVVNIFVLGDLVLDSAIFVRRKTKSYQVARDGEAYEVIRRVHAAGGAANCARILACLSKGRTFLWGLTGHSPWGRFSDVLKSSHIWDNAPSTTVFRGVHEEAISMNTITRIISLSDGVREHELRFDDTGQACVTQSTINTAVDHLKNAHTDVGIHAIILNDLDMNALSTSLIESVADFAAANDIPLFVDPKRDIEKYQRIRTTAILPNLKEWCGIIGEGSKDEKWRTLLGNRDGQEKIALRSLKELPNFMFHVIKCDTYGAIVIGPSVDHSHAYSGYHIDPHEPLSEGTLPHQLGCGDVLTAVLALEYASSDSDLHPTKRLLSSFRAANSVVAAYREMSWHRMPSHGDVLRLRKPAPKAKLIAASTAAARYIPDVPVIDLKDVTTAIPEVYSADSQFIRVVEDLLDFFVSGWTDTDMKSMILTASGGSGKTKIVSGMRELLDGKGVKVAELDLSDARSVKDIEKAVKRERRGLSAGGRLLLTVDEAFKRGARLLTSHSGVSFLEAGHSRNTRFLLIDADFEKYRKKLSGSQFLSRCVEFRLPSIVNRPHDIVYVFVAGCFSEAKKHDIANITCERGVLEAVTDWTLAGNISARKIYTEGRGAFKKACDANGGKKSIVVKMNHLRTQVVSRKEVPDRSRGIIRFRL